MRSKPIHGTASGERKQRLFVEFSQQWADLLPWHHYNWRNFTLIKFQGELDHMTGRWVVELAVLGLGVEVTYVYDHSFNEQLLSVKDQIIEELKAETGAKEVKDPLGLLDQLPKIH